jgi:hypothetical protein
MFKTIIIQNKIFNIYSHISESDDMFINRIHFINKYIHLFKSFKECISYSLFYQNIIYNSCSYSEDIVTKLNNLSTTI